MNMQNLNIGNNNQNIQQQQQGVVSIFGQSNNIGTKPNSGVNDFFNKVEKSSSTNLLSSSSNNNQMQNPFLTSTSNKSIRPSSSSSLQFLKPTNSSSRAIRKFKDQKQRIH